METRLLIAWALIALLAAGFALAGWRFATRRSRRRRRSQIMRDRWLGLRPDPSPGPAADPFNP